MHLRRCKQTLTGSHTEVRNLITIIKQIFIIIGHELFYMYDHLIKAIDKFCGLSISLYAIKIQKGDY